MGVPLVIIQRAWGPMETQGPEKIGWPSWRTRPISGRPKTGFGVLGADVEGFVVIY